MSAEECRAELEDDLARIDDAHRAIDRARRDLEQARQAAHHRILVLAYLHQAEGDAFPPALARHLYWHRPDIRVETIGHAIGIPRASEVHHAIGPAEQTVRVTCSRCGGHPTDVRFDSSNRARAAQQRQQHRRQRCADCLEADRQAQHDSDARYRAHLARLERRKAELRVLMAAGLATPDLLVAEFRDEDGDGGPLRIVVAPPPE